MTSKVGRQGITIHYLVTQVVGIFLCILVLVWCMKFRGGFGGTSHPAQMFNWHSLCMTVGMVYLLANSITFFKTFIDILDKRRRKQIHAGIHTVVLVLAIIGLTVAIVHTNMLGYTNFSSLHSWLGIATLILFFLQWIVGFVSFLHPGLASPLRAAIMPHHVFFGFCSFILATACSITGVFERVLFIATNDHFPPEVILVNCIGLLFALFGVLVTYGYSQ